MILIEVRRERFRRRYDDRTSMCEPARQSSARLSSQFVDRKLEASMFMKSGL
jgi:hypothetical protein